MKILFLRPAEVELQDAIDYYNRQRPGLGYEFAAEIKRTVRRIRAHPEAWHLLSPNTRRSRLNRFPYAIVYAYCDNELTILAVMHMSRHPDSWKGKGLRPRWNKSGPHGSARNGLSGVMSIEILRVDTDDDLKAQLDTLLWRVLWAPLGLPADIRHQFRLPGPGLELVAVMHDQITGGAVFHRLEAGQCELRHIAVKPRYQSSGIGRQLFREGAALLSDEGCQVISTIARNTSSAFFAKLGFVPVSEPVPDHPIFLKHGIRFQKMVWSGQ